MAGADALAALRIWAIDVDLGGTTLTIPPRSARDWFEAILREDPLPIVPGLMGDGDQQVVEDLLLAGSVDLEEIVARSRDALQVAAGRPWWQADRLIRSAADQWTIIGGELTRLGVDLEKVSLAAALNTIYVVCVRTMTEEERNSFDIQLRTPPTGVPGLAVEDMYDQQAAESAFLALMAQSSPPTP